jgi:hypothetical protein
MVERVGFAISGDNMQKREEFFISEEVAEWIGLKKSEYLSRLILKQSQDDIKFEDFHIYDSYIPDSIESPDSIFERIVDQQIIRTYIKSYVKDQEFHQVVIGVILEDKKHNSQIMVPILSFVSINIEVIKEFMEGEKVLSPKLN